MNFLTRLLKPAPHAEAIQDPDQVKKQYKYWRFRIFYSMYVGYAFYYFTRKSFTFAMPSMMQELGFDKSELGILGSILSITYGISKFASGIFGDRSNPRYFMALGLIMTALFNILFGLSSTIVFFAIFWGLNGWFQGMGWPPCARLLTHWYTQSERGTWWGIWSTAHSVGGALIPILATYCAQSYGWRYAMYVPGVLCLFAGLFLMNRLRDTPQSLGLPTIERFKNEEHGEKSVERELSIREILFKYVLKNKYVWILAISYFFVYVVRTAINDWTILFLVEHKGYSVLSAGMGVFWFEVGGFVGTISAGWASDRIFKGRRAPMMIIFSAGVTLAVAAFWYVPAGNMMLDFMALFAIGCLIFGPQMLTGIAAAELSHKKAAATSSGFAGYFAYLGAAAAGYPLGKVAQDWGWHGFFIIVGICGILVLALLIPLWSVKANPQAA